ncbi:hypothetical protein CCHOA_02950 [Corynebacterium choanae]|uniref:Uncharacterized protein n=1 Tax=Corynebacterium choanae TaxID=1862358 RepID=A0A3G6J4W7_9CORY|nr:hypothetical protein CCHOA_02950 [Corynebacterium choanae]
MCTIADTGAPHGRFQRLVSAAISQFGMGLEVVVQRAYFIGAQPLAHPPAGHWYRLLAASRVGEQCGGVKTRCGTSMASPTLLVDGQQHRVAVTVDSHLPHILGVS